MGAGGSSQEGRRRASQMRRPLQTSSIQLHGGSGWRSRSQEGQQAQNCGGEGDVSLVGTGTRGAPPRSAAGAVRREGLRLQRLTGFVQELAIYPLSSEAGMEEGGAGGQNGQKDTL